MIRFLLASLLLPALAPILSQAHAQTCTPIAPDAHDGAIVSTRFHKVIYEDQDVRVLEVINPPHTMEETTLKTSRSSRRLATHRTLSI